MTQSLLTHLNPQQRNAVTLAHQSALILAGAGSGKTRVLTTRIAWLIATNQANPQTIMAVTFTNKAANEMSVRLSAMLPIAIRGMWIGTFHGLCNRLLRAHHRDANLPPLFQIMDSQDQQSLLKRLYKEKNINQDRFPLRQLQYFINDAKEQGLRPNQVEASDEFSARQVEHYAAYEQMCQREGVVDFAELLLRSFELLNNNHELREHYQARFSHVLVDEFQDTNILQYRWLKSLAGKQSAMFAVGDDDQSIYAFRGANVANMQKFQSDYAPVSLIKLEQNYRSLSVILDAANALIQNNATRLGKNLWTDAGRGEPIIIYGARSDGEEASFVVEQAKNLIQTGQSLQEIAVLYRSNAQSRVLEHALFNAGIPYRVYGGMRFFERAEVKHALAYLRLVANPEDDNALLRVINFPTRGIGARSIIALQDESRAEGCSLWQIANAQTSGKSAVSITGFVKLVEDMRTATSSMILPELIEYVMQRSGLLNHYRNEKDSEERLSNLQELINAAVVFARENPEYERVSEALGAFLAHAALETGETQAAEGLAALQLMTVHAAKGLEFHAVFVTGLEEGLFPHENSLQESAGTEEERRLMYVAITRARQRLYLTYSQSRMLHGQLRYNIPSRFIREIPEACLQWLTPYVRGNLQSEPQLLPERAAHSLPWRIGQSVQHAKFGVGVIVDARGRGADLSVQVNFRGIGTKWLSLAYAQLQPAS